MPLSWTLGSQGGRVSGCMVLQWQYIHVDKHAVVSKKLEYGRGRIYAGFLSFLGFGVVSFYGVYTYNVILGPMWPCKGLQTLT